MIIDTITLLAGPVVMLLAYTVFGISGFGSALVSIPLLAHMLPLRLVVPTVLLLDFSAAALSGWRFRHQVVRTEVRSVAPFLVVGAVATWALLAALLWPIFLLGRLRPSWGRAMRFSLGLFAGAALCFGLWLVSGGWGPPSPLFFALLGVFLGWRWSRRPSVPCES